MADSELDEILNTINSKSLPPLHLWNPQLSGDMDMRIAADGSWYYKGSLIQRQSMVNLFSTILRIEDDQYFLVTPVEKFRIIVDEMPFVAVLVDRINSELQTLVFTTNVSDKVIADAEHQIWVVVDEQTDEPRPYLHVRNGLNALIHRNAFYQLVQWSREEKINGVNQLAVSSQNESFVLGRI